MELAKASLQQIVAILNQLPVDDRDHVLVCLYEGFNVYSADGSSRFEAGTDRFQKQRRKRLGIQSEIDADLDAAAKLSSRDDWAPGIREETIRFLETKASENRS